MIVALAGGVGAARFLRGLVRVVDPTTVTVVVNTADDDRFHGLAVSPDLDTVTYTLAGAEHPEQGWGLAGESFRVMDALDRYGEATWFRLGDRDLATHLYRTRRLEEGATLTEVTAEIADRVGRAVPGCSRCRTTGSRPASRSGGPTAPPRCSRCRSGSCASAPRRRSWRCAFAGADAARPGPDVLDAIDAADTILVCPSNPVISIGPILAVPGIRDALVARRDRVVGVSPIIAGAPVKGPADRLMDPLGIEVSCVGVARAYAEFCGTLVIDTNDAARARRGRGGRAAGGGRRHADARRPRRGRARAAHARRRGLMAGTAHPARSGASARSGPAPRSARSSSTPRRAQDTPLLDGDCLVVTQKIVSKAEGRLVPLDHADFAARAELIASETVRVLRRRDELVITETRHGFVCANAGIDLSNVDEGYAALLPVDSDRSAHRIRNAIRAAAGVDGRRRSSPTRSAARGATGSPTSRSAWPASPRSSTCAAAPTTAARSCASPRSRSRDEIASAAELVMGKASGIPVAIVRGLDPEWFGDGSYRDLDPPGRPGPVPVTRDVVPAFLEARRSIRAFTDAPVDAEALDAIVDRRVHRARAAPLAPVALRHRRHRRRQGGARRRHGRALARRPRRRRRARRARSTSSSTRVTPSSPARPRSCSAASPGTASTAIPTRRAGAPSGAWRCCRSAPRSRTSCSPPPTPGSRRAGSRRRSSAPRPRATRSRCPTSGCPHACVLVGHPDPAYVGRVRPPIPLDELRAPPVTARRVRRRP